MARRVKLNVTFAALCCYKCGVLQGHGALPFTASHESGYPHVHPHQPALPTQDTSTIPVPPVVPSPGMQHGLPCMDHAANVAVEHGTMGNHALSMGNSAGNDALTLDEKQHPLVMSPPDEAARQDLKHETLSEGMHLHTNTGVMPSSVQRIDVSEMKFDQDQDAKYQSSATAVPDADVHSAHKRIAEVRTKESALQSISCLLQANWACF